MACCSSFSPSLHPFAVLIVGAICPAAIPLGPLHIGVSDAKHHTCGHLHSATMDEADKKLRDAAALLTGMRPWTVRKNRSLLK